MSWIILSISESCLHENSSASVRALSDTLKKAIYLIPTPNVYE